MECEKEFNVCEITWENFKKNEFWVVCRSEKQAKKLCGMMYDQGMTWCNGDSYLERTNWNLNTADTLYYTGLGRWSPISSTLHALIEFKQFEKEVGESKVKLSWKRFKSNEFVVQCGTIDEANEMCRMMTRKGLTWCSSDSYVIFNNWDVYGEDTCYSGTGVYGSVECYTQHDTPIVSFQEFKKAVRAKKLKLSWERYKNDKFNVIVNDRYQYAILQALIAKKVGYPPDVAEDLKRFDSVEPPAVGRGLGFWSVDGGIEGVPNVPFDDFISYHMKKGRL